MSLISDNHSNEQSKQGYEGRGRRSSLKQEKSHVMVSKGRGKPSGKSKDHIGIFTRKQREVKDGRDKKG